MNFDMYRLDVADGLLAEGVQLHTVLARSSREFDIYRHPELAAWRGGERGPIDALIQGTIEAGTWKRESLSQVPEPC